MQRKLTAILSADVVGYSGLMESDEAGTLERLKANRARIFDPHITIHGGRVFKLIGDGALAEFTSVIAAVECALAIQEATEADGGDDRRIRYRIGINLGEVIIEGDDIYGEGVNVAARIQALAPVGGVALSRIVKEQIDGKARCTLEDIGEHKVKNIEHPVHVFSARPVSAFAAAESRTKPAPQQKPIVCVLPFTNMSGDAEQEYFSDGISEDIITDLSKVSALDVVARNTSFQFKGKNVDTAQIARQLKVSHVLEGSVRKSGGRVRITAQLIDGTSANHVWAERYDRDLNDIFALQDEISEAIVAALKLKLVPEEKKAIEQRGTENVEAYDLYLMARNEFTAGRTGNARRYSAALRLSQRVTEVDPNFARGWALRASVQAMQEMQGTQGEQAGPTDDGMAAVERALMLDGNLADAHAIKAFLLSGRGKLDDASNEIAVALTLDPDSYEVVRAAGLIRYRQHRYAEAIGFFEKTASLLDTDHSGPFLSIGCYREIGDEDGMKRAAAMTIGRTESILARDPNDAAVMGTMSIALSVLGQPERAREMMRRALLVEPDSLLMRYNFACTLAAYLKDVDGAIEMVRPVFERSGAALLNHAKNDADFDLLRGDPRFQAMVAAAEKRLSAAP